MTAKVHSLTHSALHVADGGGSGWWALVWCSAELSCGQPLVSDGIRVACMCALVAAHVTRQQYWQSGSYVYDIWYMDNAVLWVWM